VLIDTVKASREKRTRSNRQKPTSIIAHGEANPRERRTVFGRQQRMQAEQAFTERFLSQLLVL
jgi:hypothetical protein